MAQSPESEANILKNKKTKKTPNPARHKMLTRLGELISDGLSTMVVWNFLFLLTCIPIITIGPALAALHFCINALVKDDLPQDKAAKLYFSAFYTSFRRAFPLGLLILAVCTIFGGGFFFYLSMVPDNMMYIPFTSASALVLLLFWGVLTHLLPMLFDMDRTDWDTKKVFLKKTPMRDLWHEAAYKALESMKGTIIAMVFSIIFLGGQLMMFPVILPFTVTIGFSFPAMAGALSHTEPDV